MAARAHSPLGRSAFEDYAVETTAVNILDWASAYGFRLTPALLATVDIPSLVL